MPPVQPEASVVQVGLGIRYVDEFCYAFSGILPASTSSQDMFSFTSGSGVIVGVFTMNGQSRFLSPTSGGYTTFELVFNDLIIGNYKVNTDSHDMPNQNYQKIIIPPFTKVVLRCMSSEDNVAEDITASLTGRVYGAE
jgi:hypothetical protein